MLPRNTVRKKAIGLQGYNHELFLSSIQFETYFCSTYYETRTIFAQPECEVQYCVTSERAQERDG